MPMAVVTWVASALTVGFTQSVWVTIAQFVATQAVSAGINSLMRKDVSAPSLSDPGRQLQFQPSPNAARQFIYGETLTTGQPVMIKTSGTDREYLDMIIAIGDGGPYESIEAITFDNGSAITLDGSGNATAPSNFVGLVTINYVLGTESQSAIAGAVSNITEWTTNHAGKGVCHAHVRLKWDPEVWTSGRPTIYFKVRGRLIYDQRLDTTNGGSGTHRKDDATTWEWTQNRALWIQDYIRGIKMNGQRVGGLGISDTLVDWATNADAADDCDASVSVVGGGSIPAFTGGGALIGSDDDPAAIINAMLDCMAGEIAPRSGYVALYAGAARAATVTLDDDDLAGPVKLTTARSIRTTVNTIASQYREPEEGYEWTDAPAYSVAGWVTDDGEVFRREISLNFEDDNRRAQRISKIIGWRMREPRMLTATWKQCAMQVKEGSTFTWSSSRFPAGVVGKYVCLTRTINPDGTVEISARSEDDAKYDWDESTEEVTRSAAGLIDEPSTQIGVGLATIDATASRNAILGSLPEYTLRLNPVAQTYDSNLTNALGFVDLADWDSHVDNRPTELTDGRVAAGLDASGDLNRNIGSSRLDSSNALRRTGGGLFTGALAATAGATWGSDVGSIPTELSDGRITTALDGSGILQTNFSASQATSGTLPIARISGLTPTQLASGYGLISAVTSFPASTGNKILEDTTGNRALYDDGTTVRRLSAESFSGTLGSNISVSSSSYVVIASAAITNINEQSLIWVPRVGAAFQTAHASDISQVGQWAIYIHDGSVAANAAITTASAYRKVWEGDPAGLTFTTPGVIKASNDLESANEMTFGVVPLMPFVAGATFVGATMYVSLVLRVASGGGSINIATGATSRIDATVTG